jgi:hypothetical protein
MLKFYSHVTVQKELPLGVLDFLPMFKAERSRRASDKKIYLDFPI